MVLYQLTGPSLTVGLLTRSTDRSDHKVSRPSPDRGFAELRIARWPRRDYPAPVGSSPDCSKPSQNPVSDESPDEMLRSIRHVYSNLHKLRRDCFAQSRRRVSTARAV